MSEELNEVRRLVDCAVAGDSPDAVAKSILAYLRTEAKDALASVWQQARENHAAYSATGDVEQDIRFFGLGLAGEAGEVANFIKKRWRDGDGHDDDLRKECADVFAYNIMLADALGMTPASLTEMVAHKQQVFIAKMKARPLPTPDQFTSPSEAMSGVPAQDSQGDGAPV